MYTYIYFRGQGVGKNLEEYIFPQLLPGNVIGKGRRVLKNLNWEK